MSSSSFPIALTSLTYLLGREILVRAFEEYEVPIKVFSGLAVGICFKRLSVIPEEILLGLGIYGLPDFIYLRSPFSALLPGIGLAIATLVEEEEQIERSHPRRPSSGAKTVKKNLPLDKPKSQLQTPRQKPSTGPGTSHATYVYMLPPLSAFSDGGSIRSSTLFYGPSKDKREEIFDIQNGDPPFEIERAEYFTAREPSIISADSTPRARMVQLGLEGDQDIYVQDEVPVVSFGEFGSVAEPPWQEFTSTAPEGIVGVDSPGLLLEEGQEGGGTFELVEDVSETASQATTVQTFELRGPARELKKRAEVYRQQSMATRQVIEVLQVQRKQALQASRGGEAFRLKYRIKELLEDAEKTDRKAAKLSFRARNTIGSGNSRRIDVHALKPAEALRVTEEALRAIQEQGGNQLTVIVGQGLHSEGKPILKPHIMRKMRQQKMKVFSDATNAGVISILLT